MSLTAEEEIVLAEIVAAMYLEDHAHAGMILCCVKHGTPLVRGLCAKCGFALDMQSTFFEFVSVEAQIDYLCREYVRGRCVCCHGKTLHLVRCEYSVRGRCRTS